MRQRHPGRQKDGQHMRRGGGRQSREQRHGKATLHGAHPSCVPPSPVEQGLLACRAGGRQGVGNTLLRLASQSRSCSSMDRLPPGRDAASTALRCGVARMERERCCSCTPARHAVTGRTTAAEQGPAVRTLAAAAADQLPPARIPLAAIETIARVSQMNGRRRGAGAGRWWGILPSFKERTGGPSDLRPSQRLSGS